MGLNFVMILLITVCFMLLVYLLVFAIYASLSFLSVSKFNAYTFNSDLDTSSSHLIW